ncbi:MAG: DUF349 domain-containing protein, partial [Psychroserpens sp.]|nr:DUF349 domain-containing protein [Psychroserpens sp.]
MSEKDNLPKADGLSENSGDTTPMTPDEVKDTNVETANTIPEPTEAPVMEEAEAVSEDAKDEVATTDDGVDAHVEEIEEANAEDAEDESNAERHTLE